MYHHRRKSGHGESTTDVRRHVTVSDGKHRRPSMGRRQTPVGGQKLSRSQREREREWQDSWADERESFPQFCTTCEKQFMSNDERFLYCSENCRRVDQNSTSATASVRSYGSGTYPSYSQYSSGSHEPRDIIPRASPSRPSSMHYSTSPPASPGTTKQYTSAMASLRSFNTRPVSPPSPAESSGSGIWPFSRSAATSPSTSYSRPSSSFLSSTYDSGYTYDLGGGAAGATDYRPLPSRRPGGHSSRPKSIELVTPMVGR